jgi:hypothetical protein
VVYASCGVHCACGKAQRTFSAGSHWDGGRCKTRPILSEDLSQSPLEFTLQFMHNGFINLSHPAVEVQGDHPSLR